jgi:hypothetical protein
LPRAAVDSRASPARFLVVTSSGVRPSLDVHQLPH